MKELNISQDIPSLGFDPHVVEKFEKDGFLYLPGAAYEVNTEASTHLIELQNCFNFLAKDEISAGARERAYLKLDWDRNTDSIWVSPQQAYFQSPEANSVDGGKTRQFAMLDPKIIDNTLFQRMVRQNLKFIELFSEVQGRQKLTIGIHLIRYHAYDGAPAFSSPVWLHKDDEPLVFVHLFDLSLSAVGGDNIIAEDASVISQVIRLENPLDTIVLNRKVFHAVTPLGTKIGATKAHRDVMLFTVEKEPKSAVSSSNKEETKRAV